MTRWTLGAVLAGTLMLGGGCLQIETRIKLNEDGSAKMTERVFFSERLLELAGAKRAEFVALLGKERLLERMKQMGEGLTLVSHETRTGGDGWMESAVEIAIPDLNKFRYSSPWAAYLDYADNNQIRTSFVPQYKSHPYAGGPAGSMSVSFALEKSPKGKAAPPKDAPPPKGPTPKEQQVYRDIAPVVKDMLKGFRLRFTFESYAPVVSGLGVRGAGATAIDLLDVSDANMDQWGSSFWENEEVMLELSQWDLGGPNIVRNVQGYAQNWTLPVFTPLGSDRMWWLPGGNIWFAPSKPLFDKHFEGKMLDYAGWGSTPADKQTPARFRDIGWKGYKETVEAEKKPEPEAK